MTDSRNAPLMLSVSGARGIVGESMTPAVAADYARAFGSFVTQTTGGSPVTLCVGRDTRPSSETLCGAAVTGLTASGCAVIDLGVVATPTVAVMITEHRAAGGLVVTGSHNPIEWNGLKCLNACGIASARHDVDEITRRFKQRDFRRAERQTTPAVTRDQRGHEMHVKKVLANLDGKPIQRAKLKVVLDSVNGAGGVAGRMLLERLGCTLVHLNAEPTGRFAHGPEPVEENVAELAQLTAAEGADCGFAQDPDADRLAIIDETGRFIGEEYTVVLAAKRMFDLHGGGPIVVNLSTSRMIDDLAGRYPGATVIRTPVGEANVAATMQQAGAMIGGEGNGGVIFPKVCFVRDSLSAMTIALSLLVAEGRPLSEIVAELPHYEMIKHRFDLKQLSGNDAAKEAVQRVTDHFAEADINTADGVRVDFADGWVHLRPSNTEPIIRLIAEAKTGQRAGELLAEVALAARLRSTPKSRHT